MLFYLGSEKLFSPTSIWFTREEKQSKYHRFLNRHLASSGFAVSVTWHAICTTARTEGKAFSLCAASRGLLLLHIASRLTAARIDWQQNTYVQESMRHCARWPRRTRESIFASCLRPRRLLSIELRFSSRSLCAISPCLEHFFIMLRQVTRLLCRDIANLWGLSLGLASTLAHAVNDLVTQLYKCWCKTRENCCDDTCARSIARAPQMRFQFGIARGYFPHRVAIFHHTNKQFHCIVVLTIAMWNTC